MWLPTKDVPKPVGLYLRNGSVKNNGEGCCHTTLASSNRGFGRVVRLVGIVMIVVNHVVTLVFVDGFARFEVTRWFLCRGGNHGENIVVVW